MFLLNQMLEKRRMKGKERNDEEWYTHDYRIIEYHRSYFIVGWL